MVSRGHYVTFLTLRNKAVTYRSFTRFDNGSDEEKVTLVSREENGDVEMHSMDPPYWVAYVEQFRFETEKVSKKIDQLEESQKNLLKLKNKEIFGDDLQAKKNDEIDQKCTEISRLFNRLHSLVNQMKNIPRDNGLKGRLIKNILQWEYQVISKLSSRFSNVQKDYLHKLKEYDKFMIKFEDSGDQYEMASDHYDINLLDDFDRPTVDLTPQSQKSQYLPADNRFLQLREKEMEHIMNSMEELNQVFHNINTAVIHQGSLLDRIDYNIENVQMSVQQGVVELTKAERSVRRSRKMKCILIIAFSIFLLLILTIIQS